MHELLLWQNVIFWAPMVVGTLLYGLSSVMGDDGGHDQDAAEVDVHADIPSNVSAGAEAHVEAGHGDVNPDQDAVLTGSVWSYFGLGKVPLAAVLASLMFGWGIAGLVLNLTIGVPRITLSLFIAAAFSLAFTRIVSRLIARYVPSYQSYSHSGARLFLTEGEVLYTVSAKSGTVRVLDRFNNLRDLDSRVRPGEPAIAKGEKVYIDDYDEHSHTYFVRSSVQ